MKHPFKRFFREIKLMATLADQILDIQNKVTALQTAVAAIPTTATGAAIDLTATNAKIDAVQTTVNAIDAKLTPTP